MRKPISKKLRFEIFKRDLFCCQYCGKMPPNTVLEVDHIVPVSKNGTNDIDNLLTSCFDCNRGKGANELNVLPQTTTEKIEVLKEKEIQYKEFKKFQNNLNKLIESDIDEVEDIYSLHFPKWGFGDKFRISVKNFIKELGLQVVKDSMEKSCLKMNNENHALKYFCGICWNIIRER